MRLPKPGEIWKHFKGNEYMIDSIREDEDGSIIVCYGGTWTRRLVNFMERVDREHRFTFVREAQAPSVVVVSEVAARRLRDLAAGFNGNIDDALRAGQSLDDLGAFNPLINAVVDHLGS